MSTTPPVRSLDHVQIESLIKTARGYLVDSMIQERTVNILVGDSGIGKTPLLQQLALSVALGRSFLSLSTRPARVLSIDYENSATELNHVLRNLSKFFSLPYAPSNYRALLSPESKAAIELEIRAFQPELIIIDALRGFDHKAEKTSEDAMACLDWLHKKAEKYHAAFLILHHIRKPDSQDPPPRLSALSQPVLTWLLQTSGSRALINQTESRFAVEEYTQGESSLLMRGHVKLTGETPPIYIERVYDPDEPEPLGYARIIGPALLSQADRERASRLPARFTWAEAESALGIKRGKSLLRLISVCCSAGLITKIGSGKSAHYVRIDN